MMWIAAGLIGLSLMSLIAAVCVMDRRLRECEGRLDAVEVAVQRLDAEADRGGIDTATL
jgi:hypothetical protein